MRLFVALRLDAELHRVLEERQADLQRLDPGRLVRWVDPAGIHLTLLFLGEVAEARVPGLRERLREAVAGEAGPRLALGRLGAFPSPRRPRVLWVGLVETGAALAPLHAAVTQAGEALGWPAEKRAFQPHLTLGRVREERDRRPAALPPALLHALQEPPPPPAPARVQTHVALMRSHLSPAGARYEAIEAWELAAPAQGER